jgi:hypothetical protein
MSIQLYEEKTYYNTAAIQLFVSATLPTLMFRAEYDADTNNEYNTSQVLYEVQFKIYKLNNNVFEQIFEKTESLYTSNYTITTDITINDGDVFKIYQSCIYTYGFMGFYTATLTKETLYKVKQSPFQACTIIDPAEYNVLLILNTLQVVSNKSELFIFKNRSSKICHVFCNNTCMLEDDANKMVTLDTLNALVLFNEGGTNWYIANMFNSGIPKTEVGGVPNTRVGYAEPGKVNIFDIKTVPDREYGNNLCILPNPAYYIGSLCIVVYAGFGDKSNNGHALFFRSPSGNGIDDSPSGIDITNLPYIHTTQVDQSTGIIFVSDGNGWYIVGNYETSNLGWGYGYYSPDDLPMSSIYSKIFLQNDSSLANEKTYSLPSLTNDISGNSYFIIVKTRNITGYTQFSANKFNSTTNNLFNGSASTIYSANGYNKGYMCYWFVSDIRLDEPDILNLNYYPLIVYAPP